MFPVTWADVENSPEISIMRENPVMAVELIGLTPISPVMSESFAVLIPVLARITKSPAVPRSSGSSGCAALANGTSIDTVTNSPSRLCQQLASLFVSLVVFIAPSS